MVRGEVRGFGCWLGLVGYDPCKSLSVAKKRRIRIGQHWLDGREGASQPLTGITFYSLVKPSRKSASNRPLHLFTVLTRKTLPSDH